MSGPWKTADGAEYATEAERDDVSHAAYPFRGCTRHEQCRALTPAWVFTFGQGQRLRSTNREGRSRLEGFGEHLGIGFRLDNRYVRIPGEHHEARAAMVAIFGQVWSMAYFAGPEADAMIAEYELVELDISEPLAELSWS